MNSSIKSIVIALCSAITIAVAAPGPVGPATYSAKAGSISFSVGSNIPFLKVSGASKSIKGGGQGTLNGDTASVRNLRFEVEAKSFKTGMQIRDDHLYDKVFKAGDGSFPTVVLRADSFTAKPDASKWTGTLQGQLTLRGVTKPVSFRATLEKKGTGALVSASGSVKTSDFGVAKISYSGAVVDDSVTISVSNLRVEP